MEAREAGGEPGVTQSLGRAPASPAGDEEQELLSRKELPSQLAKRGRPWKT